MSRLVVIALLTGMLAACGGPAAYKPIENGVGYGDQKLEANRYRVWFAGNSRTPRETVEDFVLYRAAEITLEQGYDYFVLSDRTTDGERQASSGVSLGLGGIRFGSRSGVSVGTGIGIPIGSNAQYYGQADVTLMRGRKPPEDLAAYDAREIKANLQRSVAKSLMKE